MSTRSLAVSTIVTLALAMAGLPVFAQTTPPAKKEAPAAKKMDTNKDGKVSKEERKKAQEKWEANFKAADKNKDGALTKDELKDSKAFPRVAQNFNAIDTNKDGKVSLEEVRAWQAANRAEQKKQK